MLKIVITQKIISRTMKVDYTVIQLHPLFFFVRGNLFVPCKMSFYIYGNVHGKLPFNRTILQITTGRLIQLYFFRYNVSLFSNGSSIQAQQPYYMHEYYIYLTHNYNN